MRKFLSVMVLVFCGTFAFAQKAELAGGYNYLHIDTTGSPGIDSSMPAGFFVDGTYYFLKFIGLTGDFEYNKHTFPVTETSTGASVDLSELSFHAGPRVKIRMGRVEPFAHALFGFTRGKLTDPTLSVCATSDCTDTAFSMKLGGGLDVGVSHHFAIRLGEFNYYMTKFGINSPVNTTGFTTGLPNDKQNNYTFSAGIVIR